MTRFRLPVLLGLLCCTAAQAAPIVDVTPADFTHLGTRPVGMGGAWVAYGPDEQGLFHNPATLARHKLPRFGTSHSARHFPGPHERDHLDADPTALIWPITPCFTIGQGWVTQGELGYAHHDLSDPAFPPQHLWGTERSEALAWDLLLLQLGVSHRTQTYRYADPEACRRTPALPALDGPSLTMAGEGLTWGLLAQIAPGVRYGYSESKLEQDYFPAGALTYGVSKVQMSHGWTVHPTGWLTLTRQTDQVRYRTLIDGVKAKQSEPPATRWGMECWLGPWLAVRTGASDIGRTWGVTLDLPLLPAFHYGEAEALMQRISLAPWPAGKYDNTHHYSWSLGL